MLDAPIDLLLEFGAPGTKAARPAVYKLKAEEMVSQDGKQGSGTKEQGASEKTSSVKKKAPEQGPAPIVVGEAADKSSVKRRLKELMRR